MIRGVDDASNYDARHVAKTKKGRTWPVYKRLLGYVMAKHKARLAIAFVCGFLAAMSLGAVLLGGMSYLDVVFSEESAPGEIVAQVQDQVGGMISKVGFREDLLSDRIAEWVPYLRTPANQMKAVLWLAVAILGMVVLGGAARFFQEYLSASIATYVTVDLG
ncbi:MAG: hypothetical protein GY851_26935, partial [bacterium]|nr:hypothetical protein [bacterium]